MGRSDNFVWWSRTEPYQGGDHAPNLCDSDWESSRDEQRGRDTRREWEGEGRERGGEADVASWRVLQAYRAAGDDHACAEQTRVEDPCAGKGCALGACIHLCSDELHGAHGYVCTFQHSVYTRAARVTNPPVLQRGSQKLTYGPGVNAPWNSAFSSAPTATPAPGKGKEKDGVNGMPNGKDKDKEKETPRSLPDARLYATWNYEQKRYDEPLVVRRRLGSVAAVPMGRARSESTNA